MFLRKILTIVAILFGVIFSFSTLSHIFDGDFGWYLRFGQAVVSGSFPYTDTYTWSYAGQPWVNHEWGGNIVFWLLYSRFGYIALEVCVTILITTAFFLAPVIFLKKFSVGSFLASLLSLLSIDYLLSVRPTTVAPLFLVWLLYTLEKLPERKLLFTWPLLFWLWAAWHGSWILGVIVICIYLGGALIEKFFPTLKMKPSGWTTQTFQSVVASLGVSFLVTALNPYGFEMWREVGSYFTEHYFKSFITEWLPSYVFPIYWSFFVLLGLSLVLLFRAWHYKKITTAHCLLFLFFALNAVLYRRNVLYFTLLMTPLLTIVFESIMTALSPFTRTRKILLIGSIAVLLGGGFYFLHQTAFINDPWSNNRLLNQNGFPVGATKTLRTLGGQQLIFNEFHWGGFLNWTLPQAQVYLDGRGTATWRSSSDKTLFENYRELRFEANGLTKIEATSANYILLQKQFTGYTKPNWLNRLTFGDEVLSQITTPTSTVLENDLHQSSHWEKVYEDKLSLLFKRRPQE